MTALPERLREARDLIARNANASARRARKTLLDAWEEACDIAARQMRGAVLLKSAATHLGRGKRRAAMRDLREAAEYLGIDLAEE